MIINLGVLVGLFQHFAIVARFAIAFSPFIGAISPVGAAVPVFGIFLPHHLVERIVDGIEQSGRIESLNVAVAVGVLLYEVDRQRRDAQDGTACSS